MSEFQVKHLFIYKSESMSFNLQQNTNSYMYSSSAMLCTVFQWTLHIWSLGYKTEVLARRGCESYYSITVVLSTKDQIAMGR